MHEIFGRQEAIDELLAVPPDAHLILAVRACLRILHATRPNPWLNFSSVEHSFVLRRVVFTAHCVLKSSSPKVKQALEQATNHLIQLSSNSFEDLAAISLSHAIGAKSLENRLHNSANSLTSSSTLSGRVHIEMELIALQEGLSTKELLDMPIWSEGTSPPENRQSLKVFDSRVSEESRNQEFWTDWYSHLLFGRGQKLKLLEEIALLPSADWERGPEHINAMIERIRKRHDLESEVEKLKDAHEKFKSTDTPHPHRLDNNPPEAIEDHNFVQNEVAKIWENLEQLDEEIEKPEPSVDVLKKIAASLFHAATRLASYCATLADVALKKAAEEVGGSGTKWAIRSSVAYYAAQTEGAKSVGSAILAFVKTLGG